VSVTADETLARGGFATSDGWVVSFSRFLVVPGRVELAGDDCDQYTDNGYSRVLDLTRSGPQQLALVYGLGPCELGFRISTPTSDSVLGAGVREPDVVALRTPGADAHSAFAGISVWVEGSAEKAGLSKRFSWPFRRFIRYEHCASGEGDALDRGILLSAGEEATVDLSVRGDALFQGPGATSAFEPFRVADDDEGNADGEVTLDELERVPWIAESGGSAASTLGDRVYLELLPNIIRYRGTGSCEVHTSVDEPDEGF
jgi:hypothetical protein